MDLNKLKELRNSKIEAMEAITAKMEAEERSIKNNEERTAFNTLKSEIEELDGEIKDAEFQATQVKEEVKREMKKDNTSKEERDYKKYDLAKAIREFKNGGLTGFEKEIQEEGAAQYKRFGETAQGIIVPEKVLRAISKSGNASHISDIASPADIVADRGILSKLGVNVLEGLTGNLKMTYSDGFNAQFYAEDASASESAYSEVDDKIEARRVSGWQGFSNEYLAQSAVMPQLMSDMMASIDTAVAKELLEEIISITGTTLTGYGAAATAKVMTYKDLMKLKGAVKSSTFGNPRFVAGGELFAELEATSRDAGSGRFLIEDGRVGGYSATDVQGVLQADGTRHELIYGDFGRANVGFFSGLEILVDPYTLSNSGKTKLTYHRLADVSVNPNAFKTILNAKLA